MLWASQASKSTRLCCPSCFVQSGRGLQGAFPRLTAALAQAQTRPRHGSPTLRAIVEASHTSYHVVRQGLATAHCSGRNALRRWSKFPAAPAVRLQAKAPPPTALFTMGVAIYGALLYVAGAAPALLPAIYLLFAAVSGPWRAWDFLRRKNAFFLIDFCYVRPLVV